MIYKKILFFFTFLFASHLIAQQNNIKNITINDGLPSNFILDIQQDSIGYLWIATKKGIVKFDGINCNQISSKKSQTIFIHNNTIYAGLEKGLFVKSNSKEKVLESKSVLKIVEINGEIYLATTQGIYKLKTNYLQPLQINTAIDFSIINDIISLNGSIYIATNKALFKTDKLNKPKKIHKIYNGNIVSLAAFKNDIIAATLHDGLKLIKNTKVQKTVATQDQISSIKKIKNELWITSNKNGIEVYTLPSFAFKKKINKYNSLKTDAIQTVFKDKQNSIWIASNSGIYSIKESNISQNKKPKIYFESLQVNHQNTDSLLTKKELVQFSPSENNISIGFKTVDLKQPKNILYRYKLNDEFSPWTSNNKIHFANLTSKKYTIQVQSKTKNNLSNISSFSFWVDTPFYKKTWFIIAAISFLFLVAYFLLDNYLKRINRTTKEKIEQLKLENHLLSLEQKALQLQMNPHFIFNVLNGIKALGNSGKTEELNTSISQFSVLLRSILNNSRKEEISLQEEIESLKNYLELEQKMSSKSFEYSIQTILNSIDADEILIPTMLIQPFIENAIKHGFTPNKKGKIEIIFSVKYNFLECSILDNGVGIHQSKKQKNTTNHNSVALKVSKERIENISTKNSFYIDEIIEDSIIKGTKVWFKIPLKTDY